MKSCIRIPRLFVPQDQEEWVSPACDAPADLFQPLSGEERVSARDCIVPDFLRGGGEEAQFEKMRENMYAALENGEIERLERGCLLVRRKTSHGERKGILANIDLEEFAPEGGGTIRLSTETDSALVQSRLKEREYAVLEFPHTVLCYRDKRDKLMRALEEEELAPVYDFQTPLCSMQGEFIYDFIAEEVVHDLMKYADPCFGVLDGNHALVAAKLHWEQVKAHISAQEARNHPARFTLVEFVNLCDPAVVPVSAQNGAPAKKEELLAMFKADKKLPAKSLALGGVREARCSFEGREISYD